MVKLKLRILMNLHLLDQTISGGPWCTCSTREFELDCMCPSFTGPDQLSSAKLGDLTTETF